MAPKLYGTTKPRSTVAAAAAAAIATATVSATATAARIAWTSTRLD